MHPTRPCMSKARSPFLWAVAILPLFMQMAPAASDSLSIQLRRVFTNQFPGISPFNSSFIPCIGKDGEMGSILVFPDTNRASSSLLLTPVDVRESQSSFQISNLSGLSISNIPLSILFSNKITHWLSWHWVPLLIDLKAQKAYILLHEISNSRELDARVKCDACGQETVLNKKTWYYECPQNDRRTPVSDTFTSIPTSIWIECSLKERKVLQRQAFTAPINPWHSTLNKYNPVFPYQQCVPRGGNGVRILYDPGTPDFKHHTKVPGKLEVMCYDPRRNEITFRDLIPVIDRPKNPSNPYQFHHMTEFSHDGSILAFAEYTERNDVTPPGQVYLYNVSNRSTRSIPIPPLPYVRVIDRKNQWLLIGSCLDGTLHRYRVSDGKEDLVVPALPHMSTGYLTPSEKYLVLHAQFFSKTPYQVRSWPDLALVKSYTREEWENGPGRFGDPERPQYGNFFIGQWSRKYPQADKGKMNNERPLPPTHPEATPVQGTRLYEFVD